MSQFDLEVAIDASPGSLSRLESGSTNPSKETIHKISTALKLEPEELASLFGIELSSSPITLESNRKPMQTIQDPLAIIQNLNLDKTLTEIITNLKQLGFCPASIYLVDHQTQTFRLSKTNASLNCISLAEQILGKSIYEVEFSLGEDNIISKTIQSCQTQKQNELFEVIFPYLGKTYSLQQNENNKLLITLPIVLNSTSIGCITIQHQSNRLDKDNSKILTQYMETSSRQIYTALIKHELDRKLGNQKAHKYNSLFTNLLNFISTAEILRIVKSNIQFRVYLIAFAFLLLYWTISQIFLSSDHPVYQFFTHIYYPMAGYAAYIGYRTYKIVGTNNRLSKMILILTLISACHTIGQILYSVTYIRDGYLMQYPSIAELFFLAATYLSLGLSIYSFNYLKRKTPNFKFNSSLGYSGFLMGICLFLLLHIAGYKDYNIYSHEFLASITDLAYNIGQTLAIVISFMGIAILRKTSVSKETTFFLVLYFYTCILLYLADLVFTIEYLSGNTIPGGISDMFYLFHYTSIGVGHIILLATINSGMDILNFSRSQNRDKILSRILD